MQLLSFSEISQVSGGHQIALNEALNSMEHYSFMFALLGGAASAIYGLCTNSTVVTATVTTLTMADSFTQVFWVGVGASWAIGAAVGLGVAVYQSQYI